MIKAPIRHPAEFFCYTRLPKVEPGSNRRPSAETRKHRHHFTPGGNGLPATLLDAPCFHTVRLVAILASRLFGKHAVQGGGIQDTEAPLLQGVTSGPIHHVLRCSQFAKTSSSVLASRIRSLQASRFSSFASVTFALIGSGSWPNRRWS